ncbi:uncharacterized protein LOC143434669 isoform X2 [Arvicanthis niloticus]|uniref:uncharacterized protein LOC143308967 isoform X2 n=1 Tax=Arvicanthis niloticus TaxID=61156 RepID=UPI00402BE917
MQGSERRQSDYIGSLELKHQTSPPHRMPFQKLAEEEALRMKFWTSVGCTLTPGAQHPFLNTSQVCNLVKELQASPSLHPLIECSSSWAPNSSANKPALVSAQLPSTDPNSLRSEGWLAYAAEAFKPVSQPNTEAQGSDTPRRECVNQLLPLKRIA